MPTQPSDPIPAGASDGHVPPASTLLTRVAGSGFLITNIAVALFGLAGVVGKATGLAAPVIVLGRTTFGALALIIVMGIFRISPRVSMRQLLPLIAQGVLLAVHWSVFFQSINVGGVAIGLLSFSTFPLFTAAVEPIVLGTKPTRTQILASVVILAGVYILVPSFSLQSTTLQGVLWGLAAASTFAVLSVVNRKLGETHSSPVSSFYQFVTATVVLLPTLIWNHPTGLFEPRTLLLLLFLGTACTALAHTMFISGLRHISTMLASLFASLEPVWGIGFAVVLIDEVPTLRSILGGLMIVGASTVAGLRG